MKISQKPYNIQLKKKKKLNYSPVLNFMIKKQVIL